MGASVAFFKGRQTLPIEALDKQPKTCVESIESADIWFAEAKNEGNEAKC